MQPFADGCRRYLLTTPGMQRIAALKEQKKHTKASKA